MTRNDTISLRTKSVSFYVILTYSDIGQSPAVGIYWHEMTLFSSVTKSVPFLDTFCFN